MMPDDNKPNNDAPAHPPSPRDEVEFLRILMKSVNSTFPTHDLSRTTGNATPVSDEQNKEDIYGVKNP